MGAALIARKILGLVASALLTLGESAAEENGLAARYERQPLVLPNPGKTPLHWRVRYGAITLGDVYLAAGDESERTVQLRLSANSAPRLPFSPLKYSFEAIYDRATTEPLYFHGQSTRGGKSSFAEYRFDYSVGTVALASESGKPGQDNPIRSLPIEPRLFDGLSLIAWMMALRGSGQDIDASFLSGSSTVPIAVAFADHSETILCGGEKVSAYRIDARLSKSGIAGLNGNFTLWLSADLSRLPLKAIFKLWVGEVTLERAAFGDEG
jgi:hypothetical protein